jgi:predicted metal-dependent peptidase
MEFSSNIDQRITDVLIDWFVKRTPMRFFGQLALQTNIKESKSLPTMGVWIGLNGFNLEYNKKFLDKINDSELKFVLIHEFMHLISYHCNRTREFNLHPRLSNIAQDCVINTEILENYNNEYTLPLGGWKIPKGYSDLRISELVYMYLQSDEYKKNDPAGYEKCQDAMKSPEQIDCSDLSEDELSDLIDELMKNGQFDVHMENEVSEEVARDISKSVYDSMKMRGLTEGNIEKFIERITPRENDILSQLKKAINEMHGGVRYETYARPNRRDIEGKKGNKHQGVGANFLLDVSGSMDGFIEFVLGYVLHDNILLNGIQVDTKVQKVEIFKSKKDLQKIQIKGYGGTELQPAVNFVNNDKKLNKLNTVILTDGYCDELDFSGCKNKIVIVSCGIPVKYKNGKWVKQIVVSKDDINDINKKNKI